MSTASNSSSIYSNFLPSQYNAPPNMPMTVTDMPITARTTSDTETPHPLYKNLDTPIGYLSQPAALKRGNSGPRRRWLRPSRADEAVVPPDVVGRLVRRAPPNCLAARRDRGRLPYGGSSDKKARPVPELTAHPSAAYRRASASVRISRDRKKLEWATRSRCGQEYASFKPRREAVGLVATRGHRRRADSSDTSVAAPDGRAHAARPDGGIRAADHYRRVRGDRGRLPVRRGGAHVGLG